MMQKNRGEPEVLPDAKGMRVAVVVSRFNAMITERLRDAALEMLAVAGAAPEDVEVLDVPGAFEIPFAAQAAATSGRFDAVVCLGCLVRGATPHFEYIASAVAHGITAASGETGVPMAFGVLTTNTVEEALERAAPDQTNKGWEAAQAALEMAHLARRLSVSVRQGLRA
jgi:6,7-dimethyl-8-ribityllumazine synthase